METGGGFGSAAPTLSCEQATALGSKLMQHAAVQASLDYEFCELLGRFDAAGGPSLYDGIKSTAHWVGLYCSMSPGPAREHVRVARCLPRMPRAAELFQQGRLSYSKMRELTRLEGLVDEAELCDLALQMTASQLARTSQAFRASPGSRIAALAKRRISTVPIGDGMVRMTVVLASEEAALVSAAIDAAGRRQQIERPAADEVEPVDQVQALVDVAGCYLDSAPADPLDDHTLVMVHVNAEQLTQTPHDQTPHDQTPHDEGDVPAGTPELAAVGSSPLLSQVCFVEEHGPIEAATAQRLVCTAQLVGAVIDRHGDVLALGTTRRLANRAQRRALRIRDHGVCQFPGCTQTRHLDVHHIQTWQSGGPTDLDNLILLCRRHHVAVHEGGIQILLASADGPVLPGCRFRFVLADGTPLSGTWRETAYGVASQVAAHLAVRHAAASPEAATATRIWPIGGGEGFSLQECVRLLFDIQTPQSEQDQRPTVHEDVDAA